MQTFSMLGKCVVPGYEAVRFRSVFGRRRLEVKKALAAPDRTWYHAGDTRGVALWLGRNASKDVLVIDVLAPPTKSTL
jgi:hypothetical protein